jgi:thiol:disulfide interchange protein DsbA
VPGKVEVVEFFWYRCPHCYSLEPVLEAWVKKLPADVQFRRIPAVLSDNWAIDARIFYAFEAMGVLDKVHKAFFDAIHKDRLNIANEGAMNEWLKKNGIDRKKFDDAVKSFGVQAKVKRAAQLSAAYQLDGVPLLAVQGKYTVSAEQGGTQNGMLATTDHLIDVARKGLGKK